jgi:Flp pilus assembly protein TadD
VELLEEATKKTPTDPTFQYHLGLAYQGVHDRDRARMHLQRALQLDPRSEHAAEIQQTLKKLERG